MDRGPSAASITATGDHDAVTSDYRIQPQNIEAEQALLGAVLIDNEALDKVSAFLEPDHFHVPVHGRIYEAARTLIQRGQVANPVTLKAFFELDEGLADIGGAQYLTRLAASAVSLVNAEAYGRLIHDLCLRRDLIRLGDDLVETAYDPEVDDSAAAQIERAEGRLFQLAETGQHEGGFRPLSSSLAEAVRNAEAAYKRKGQLSGVATGLIDLDNLLGGLHRSDLIVIAGRPSMGKTALATNIAFHAARGFRQEVGEDGETRTVDGAVVGFFSLEMSAEQLATRILAEESKIRSDHIRRGKLKNEDAFVALVQASQRLSEAPLYIDDTPALTVAQLRTRARRLRRTHGLSMVVVDYLQLLRPISKVDSRVQEISEITQGLKAVAKELDLPVIALSQLSRAVEQREDKRPQLSDLRESGTIEQDSDVVMFIYREEYYLERGEPQQRADENDEKFQQRYGRWQERYERAAGLADVIIAKQRHGPIGNVRLRFLPETTKFETYAAAERLPDPIG
ncbi:MAG: replicative DNA helicase [Alphaproteobacteria bacterium]|jgi:replicative DNA helicase|nr:replicative DNA helicase [Alphaproteobacteria bacterium]MDP6517745.1 replicative DNA helicase [Alphaproteobacteria bacterium]